MAARVARSTAVLPLLAALLPAAAGMGPAFCGEVEGVTDAKTPVRPLQLICDDDTGHAKIAAITFASFGAASAAAPSCAAPAAPAGCHLDNATVGAAVAKLCVGQRNCILPMGERGAGHAAGWPSTTTDPCPGSAKRLFVQARCSAGVGHALLPHALPPTPPHPRTGGACRAALRTWRAALGARLPLSPAQPERLPFSFRLGGESADTLLPSWDCAATDATLSDGRRSLSLLWTSPTLFAVSAEVTLWPDSAAVDSLLRFANHNATHNSPLLTEGKPQHIRALFSRTQTQPCWHSLQHSSFG